MNKTSRAIIIEDGKSGKNLLTIKKTIFAVDGSVSKVYYTLPGGQVEAGGNFEATVIRELKESLGITVSKTKEVAHIYLEDLDKEEKIYQCKYVSGTLGIDTSVQFNGSDFAEDVKYEIEKLDVNNLDKYNLVPSKIKDIIIDNYTL